MPERAGPASPYMLEDACIRMPLSVCSFEQMPRGLDRDGLPSRTASVHASARLSDVFLHVLEVPHHRDGVAVDPASEGRWVMTVA